MSTKIQTQISQIQSTKINLLDRVINPETKRYIKINGKVFNTLVENKFTYNPDTKLLSPTPDYVSVAVSEDCVINPITNRKIKIGGKIYLELLKTCTHDTDTNTLKLIDDSSIEKNEKVINPFTNRKITIGGKIYLELLETCVYDSNTNILKITENNKNNKAINPLTNRKIKIGGTICDSLTHIINPNTNRKIKIGGKAYEELLQSLE